MWVHGPRISKLSCNRTRRRFLVAACVVLLLQLAGCCVSHLHLLVDAFQQSPVLLASRHYYGVNPASRFASSREDEDASSFSFKNDSKKRNHRTGAGARQQERTPRQAATNQKTQIRWIAQSLADHNSRLAAMVQDLADAKTQAQVTAIGRRLEEELKGEKQQMDGDARDRILRVCAMVGLHKLAMELVDTILRQEKRLPSDMAQDALCNSLRKAGRLSALEETIFKLGTAAKASHTSISVVSFNIYLALLCDVAMEKDKTPKKTTKSAEALLKDAASWVLSEKKSLDEFGVIPNAISFATVLQAAAFVGDEELFRSVWQSMRERKIAPTIITYNARLRLASRKGIRGDTNILTVWEEIGKDHNVKPDRYTIDFLLPAMSRSGRMKDIEGLLDRFVGSSATHIVSNAFVAFLLTLCKAGEIKSARRLFDTYLLPSLSPVVFSDAGTLRLVTPNVRHFNSLLEGYRRQVENLQEKGSRGQLVDNKEVPKVVEEAWDLYIFMLKTPDVMPDKYTATTMLSLCRDSAELSLFLRETSHDLSIAIDDAVLRSAVTSYGRLGELSSACWLCARYQSESPLDTRLWNVLLGAIADGVRIQGEAELNLSNADIALTLDDEDCSHQVEKTIVYQLFHGKRCDVAVKDILALMNGKESAHGRGIDLPKANAQTYCLIAAILQHSPPDSETIITTFRNALASGVPADGRFVNAIIRCFGNDIDKALISWKHEIRPACLVYENRKRETPIPVNRSKGKNLLAAYNGLLYVAGRALRPEIALRLVYAMVREGLEPDETSLNCYHSGKRVRGDVQSSSKRSLSERLRLTNPYESLLFIECTKYDRNDKRRAGERRVRIIV